ncbi:MAG: hypothetical protein HOY79_00165 [Streptomyces sp.]|nr:hypothetical protein [Streptomyces sp.]
MTFSAGALPPVSPITVDTFNYAPLTLGTVLALAALLWATKGRRTYGIPEYGTADERERMEQDVV